MANLIGLAIAAAISTATAGITPTNIDTTGCVRSGCNGELCVEAGNVAPPTPCIGKQTDTCYQYSTCAKSMSGVCGWRSTPVFDRCMNKMTGKENTSTIPMPSNLDYNKVGPIGN